MLGEPCPPVGADRPPEVIDGEAEQADYREIDVERDFAYASERHVLEHAVAGEDDRIDVEAGPR